MPLGERKAGGFKRQRACFVLMHVKPAGPIQIEIPFYFHTRISRTDANFALSFLSGPFDLARDLTKIIQGHPEEHRFARVLV